MKRVKLPRDPNQRAKATLDLMLGDAVAQPMPMKNPAAVELGRLGGLKGGNARAAKLSADERSAIAKKAAQKRWADRPG